jgi:methionyl-tRNA formyltransferase
MSRPSQQKPLRTLFFGSFGLFSLIALEEVLAAGYEVLGVFISIRQPAALERLEPNEVLKFRGVHSIVGLAWQHGIPAWSINSSDSPELLELVGQLGADLASVASFDQRIPPALLASLPHGFINLHPSLLPAHRGPSPLFWVLREGGKAAGVSIHQMDTKLDHGPILAQKPLELAVGVTGNELSRLCASEGGKLLAETLGHLGQGQIEPTPQSGQSSYAPKPQAEDFALDPSWSAEHAFTFMRGTAEWHQPYILTLGRDQFWLSHAIEYDSAAQLDTPFQIEDERVAFQFGPGVLWARVRARKIVR